MSLFDEINKTSSTGTLEPPPVSAKKSLFDEINAGSPSKGKSLFDEINAKPDAAPPNKYWEAFKKGMTPTGMIESLSRSYNSPLDPLIEKFTGWNREEPRESTLGNVSKAIESALIPSTEGEAAEMTLFPKAVGEAGKAAVEGARTLAGKGIPYLSKAMDVISKERRSPLDLLKSKRTKVEEPKVEPPPVQPEPEAAKAETQPEPVKVEPIVTPPPDPKQTFASEMNAVEHEVVTEPSYFKDARKTEGGTVFSDVAGKEGSYTVTKSPTLPGRPASATWKVEREGQRPEVVVANDPNHAVEKYESLKARFNKQAVDVKSKSAVAFTLQAPPTPKAKSPFSDDPQVAQPRHLLPPEQNADMELRAKAGRDLVASGEPGERSGYSDPDAPKEYENINTSAPSTYPDFYGQVPITATPKSSKYPKGVSKRDKVLAALDKIIKDKGEDVGLDVEKVKAAILRSDDQYLDAMMQMMKEGRYGEIDLDVDTTLTGPPGYPKVAEAEMLSGKEPEVKGPPTQPELFAGKETMQAGAKPLIGRDVDMATAETEAPLFSKAAREPQAEQGSLLSGERGSTVGPTRTVETLKEVADTFRKAKDELKAALAPASIDEPSAMAQRLMIPHLSELAQKTELAQRALQSAGKVFDRMPTDPRYPLQPIKGLDVINAMEYQEVLRDFPDFQMPNLPQELKNIAIQYRTLLQDRLRQVQKFGKLEDFIEDYFGHIWKDPDAKVKAAFGIQGHRPLEGSKAFLKRRTIPSTQLGLDRGLIPAFDNPNDIMLAKLGEMDKFVMGQSVMKDFKDAGIARFFKLGEAPSEWTKIDDKIARVYQYSETEKGLIHRGDWYAPDGAARIINNYLSPGLMGKSVIYDALRQVNNTMNQFQLGFSGFHAGFELRDAMASKMALVIQNITAGRPLEAGTQFLKVPTAPIEYLWKGHNLLKEYYKPGSTTPEMAQMVQWIKQGGGRFSEPWYYRNNSIENFWKAMRTGHYGKMTLHSFPAIAEAAAKPIMQLMVPRMKAGVMEDMVRFSLAKLGPNASLAEKQAAVQRDWASVDNRLGQLVYDNLFWNRTLKDALQIGVRSVGWNFGTYREFGGALLHDFPIQAKRLTQRGGDYLRGDMDNMAKMIAQGKDPEMTPRMAYTIASPIVTAIMGAMIMYMYTGKGPQELKDYFYPKTGRLREDGSPDTKSLPAYERDFYGYYNNPVATVFHKTSPIINDLSARYMNQDFYGAEIYKTHAQMRQENRDANLPPPTNWDYVNQWMQDEIAHTVAMFTPFSFSGYQKNIERGEGLKEAIGLPFIGIMPGPAEMGRSDEESDLMQLRRGRRSILQKARQKERKSLYELFQEEMAK